MDTAPQATQERSAPPATLVIFGASGDLTRRKLIPAIESLARHNRLPARVRRSSASPARRWTTTSSSQSVLGDRGLADTAARRAESRYVSGGYDDPETYKRLAEVLDELDAQRGTAGNRLFYLSTPAEAFPPVINGLAGAGLQPAREDSFARLVIEKPYGHDLASARELDAHRARRVRRAAGLPDRPLPRQGDRPERPRPALRQRHLRADLEPDLRRPRADHRGRDARRRAPAAASTRHAGAMRDIVQNHVLQVLALAADGAAGVVRRRGDPRREGQAAAGDPAARRPRTIADIAVRGQYTRGGTAGELMPGYRDEDGVDPLSAHRDVRRRCGSRSTTGAGPACRSTCAPASGCRRGSPRSRCSSSGRRTCRIPDRPARPSCEPNALVAAHPARRGHRAALRRQGPGPLVPGAHGVSMDFSYDDGLRRGVRRRPTSGSCSTCCSATRRCSSAPTRSSSAGGSSTRSSSAGPRHRRRSRPTRRPPGARPTPTG